MGLARRRRRGKGAKNDSEETSKKTEEAYDQQQDQTQHQHQHHHDQDQDHHYQHQDYQQQQDQGQKHQHHQTVDWHHEAAAPAKPAKVRNAFSRANRDKFGRQSYEEEPLYATNLPELPNFGSPDTSIAQYLEGIEEVLENNAFETGEERADFLNNVFSEIDTHELVLMTDPVASRILQKIILLAGEVQLRVFMRKLESRFIELFMHPFASHVCQTLLTMAAVVVDLEVTGQSTASVAGATDSHGDGSNDYTHPPADLPSMETLFHNMCHEVLAFWSSLLIHPIGTYLTRVTLLILAGRPVEADGHGDDSGGRGGRHGPHRADRKSRATAASFRVRSNKSQKYKAQHGIDSAVVNRQLQVPPSFATLLRRITDEIAVGISGDLARRFAVHRVASPALQLLLSIMAEQGDIEYEGSLIDVLLHGMVGAGDNSGSSDSVAISGSESLQQVVKDPVGSHVFEVLMALVSPALFQKIYVQVFRGHLAALSLHPSANFVVQRFLAEIKNPIQLDLVIEELVPNFAGLLTQNRPGVVRSVCEACLRLQTGYKAVVLGIQRALDLTAEPRLFNELLSRLVTHRGFTALGGGQAPPPFTLQGLLILQLIVDFPEEFSRLVVDSFLAQTADLQLQWAGDAQCSRLVEKLLVSPAVPLKAKRKIIISAFQTNFATLACNANGSFIVDKCWRVADLKLKELIAAELVQSEATLRFNHSGKIVLNNCQINQFKSKRESWVAAQSAVEKKRAMFEDLFGQSVQDAAETKVRDPSPPLV
ncbi:armadillo-type protein [Dimargaris cristalligena]|uniref:Nucleolar protein 9 n=1 Tax=Dimargaris cristalligena TaxID=215637 RepID=A0A4Q0A388_9FUNG|nr:armadillo-type protein [Dimargaris cristalligena]|eukprot:RKP40348.1 armadillo-type protein [Dimargaris cristalligena]